MVRRYLFVAAAIVLIGGLGIHFLSAAEDEQQPAVSIELLQQKIEVLEQQVAELEQWKRQPQLQMAQLAEPKAQIVEQRMIPKSWTPKEINGQTYYLVPLGGKESVSAAAKND